MSYNRDKIVKGAFIGGLAAAVTTVFLTTMQQTPQARRVAMEDNLRSMFSEAATPEETGGQTADFKSMFSSAKPAEPEPHL